MGTAPRFFFTGFLFILIMITGFVLSRTGRPYGTGIFTLHKLIGLAVFIFLMLSLYRWDVLTTPNGITFMVALITCLFFIGVIVTGGIISAAQSVSPLVTLLHKILPWLTVGMTAVTFYLVARQN